MGLFETQNARIDSDVTSAPDWESKKAFSGEALEIGDAESVYIFQNIYGMSDENLSEITHDENIQEDNRQEDQENAGIAKLHNHTSFVAVDENIEKTLSNAENEDDELYFHDIEATRKANDRELEQREDDLYEAAQGGDDYMELYQNVHMDSSKTYHLETSSLLVDYANEDLAEQQAQAHDVINLAVATETEAVDDLWLGEDLVLEYSQASISPKHASAEEHSMFNYDVGVGGENHVTDIIVDSAYLSL